MLHLDIFKKALLEIEKKIPTQLYNNLDARRSSVIDEDQHIKIQELLTTCGSITPNELDMILELANRTIFHSKHKIINLMAGRVNEIINETHKAWVQFFLDNPNFFSSPKTNPKNNTTDIPAKERGKGVVGASPIILKDTKELDIEPPVESNI